MYPEQKQTACSVGLDPEPYVKSLSHILPTQNRSENNSGYQKKSKFFSQKLYNVRLYTVFPLYTVVKFTSQVNGNLFYPVVRKNKGSEQEQWPLRPMCPEKSI